jgi:hypothetical protein
MFFAYDSVLLIKANMEEAMALRETLELYENCSGQCINAEKSAIMFRKNSKHQQRILVKDARAIQGDAWNEKYLGLLVYVGRSRKKAFEYLKDKIWARIQGWIEKLLSMAGKEVLIKAVAQAIPTYAMSCFYLTKSFCNEISSMIARFWWSQQDKHNKIHWIGWETLKNQSRWEDWVLEIYTTSTLLCYLGRLGDFCSNQRVCVRKFCERNTIRMAIF